MSYWYRGPPWAWEVGHEMAAKWRHVMRLSLGVWLVAFGESGKKGEDVQERQLRDRHEAIVFKEQ